MIFLRTLFIIACLLAPLAAKAQEDWTNTEIIVRGKAPPGPAEWRITRGDAQIIILGVLPVFPKKQAWSTKRIQNALRGARQLITPATSHAGAGDMLGMMWTKGLKNHKSLQEVVPAALYARYTAAARRAGVDTRDFQHDKPVWAAVRLRREVLERKGLSDDEPGDTVIRLAHQAGVPVRAAGRYKMAPILADVNAMNDAASLACMGYTLDDIDFDLDRAGMAGAAWAIGDIATVRANYQGSALEKCLNGSDAGAAMMQRSVTDTAAAVVAASQTPGKTVAVFPLAVLLRRGGALDRLRAQGYDVSSPGD